MRGRRRLLLAVYVALIAGGAALGLVLPDLAMVEIRPVNEPEIHRLLMGVAALYVLTAALPFVPGAEIGLALLAALGGSVAFLVYICMVGALALAFGLGRLVPPAALASGFAWAGLARAAALVERAAALPPEARAEGLIAAAPGRLAPLLLRHRYLALALALNLPGNTLAGGGGGLALMAGMSRLFPPLPFLATVALAVAPVPLYFALFR